MIKDLSDEQKEALIMHELMHKLMQAFLNLSPTFKTGDQPMTRKVTNQILNDIDEGLLDRDEVIMACLKYMSEDEVADMAHVNEFYQDDEDEEEDANPEHS